MRTRKSTMQPDTIESELHALLGKRVTLFGLNYIYTGHLSSMSKTWAQLTDAAIVYETGPFDQKEWQDVQKLPHPVYVKLSSIESLMILK